MVFKYFFKPKKTLYHGNIIPWLNEQTKPQKPTQSLSPAKSNHQVSEWAKGKPRSSAGLRQRPRGFPLPCLNHQRQGSKQSWC